MANQRTGLYDFLTKPPPATGPFNDTNVGHGRSRTKIATFTGDLAQNDILVLARFKAEDTIISAKLVMTAFSVAATGDVGAYQAGDWTVADRALVSGTAEDRFCTATTMNGAINVPGTELWGENTVAITPDLLYKPLWVQCGLATKPAAGTQYDIGLKVEGANPPPAATVTVIFDYLSGD